MHQYKQLTQQNSAVHKSPITSYVVLIALVQAGSIVRAWEMLGVQFCSFSDGWLMIFFHLVCRKKGADASGQCDQAWQAEVNLTELLAALNCNQAFSAESKFHQNPASRLRFDPVTHLGLHCQTHCCTCCPSFKLCSHLKTVLYACNQHAY